LLGGLMLDHKSWDKVADVVTAADFYRKDHRLIFGAIATLSEGANPSDVVTVSEWLDNADQLEEAGGARIPCNVSQRNTGCGQCQVIREDSSRAINVAIADHRGQ
jgi:replicative DNA helicase